MATKAPSKVRAGFVRVLIPERNKTIQIRTKLANNPNYMAKHGLVLVPEPKQPPIVQEGTGTATGGNGSIPSTDLTPKITKAAPVKTKANG